MENSALVTVYYVLVNIYAFVLMFYDKKMAQKNKWRVSEKNLFITALLGGALGMYISMYTFRHKTKQMAFIILIPIFFILHIAVLYYIFMYLI